MQIIQRFKNLDVPAWALPLLVNGNYSGLSDRDVVSADKWIQDFEKQARRVGARAEFVARGEDEYFTHHPAFGLACNCVEGEILFLVR